MKRQWNHMSITHWAKVTKALNDCPIENRQLSIGCKNRKVRKGSVGIDMYVPNWANDCPERFVQADATKPLPFDKAFFGHILVKHVFEHFKVLNGEREDALRNWWPHLAIDGEMRIVVPNQWAYVREYYEGRWTDKRFSDMTFGAQDSPYEFHYYGYTDKLLLALVKKVLGSKCELKEMTFGHDAQFPISDLEIRSTFIKRGEL